MAVGYISSTEDIRTGTGDPHTFSVTVDASAKGILLFMAHGDSSTDHAPVGNAVTIGGKAMGKVTTASDAAGEPGRVDAWFLGHDLPASGSQTVSVDLASGTTDDIAFTVVQLSGSTNLELQAIYTTGTTGDTANPTSGAMSYGGRTCIAVGCIYSGHDAVSSLTVNANMSAVQDHDFGTFVARVDRQTTPGSSDFTFSYTATSEDCAMVVVAVTEEQTSTFRDYTLSLSPVGYWRLNEPSGCLTAFDRSPNLRHGTVVGTAIGFGNDGPIVSETTTAPNNFTGSNYIDVPDNDAWSLTTTGQLSCFCILKTLTNPNHNGTWMAKGTASNYEWIWVAGTAGGSGTWDTYLATAAGGERALVTTGSPSSYPYNTWYMPVVTADDSVDQLKLYINKTLIGTDSTWASTSTNGTSTVQIGRRGDGADNHNGALAEAAIFPDVLTTTEIDTLWAYATGAFGGSSAATGAAQSAAPSVGASAGNAAATGTSYATAPSVQPNAGLASATGAAQVAAPSVATGAGLASATGAAQGAGTSGSTGAGLASATAGAFQPSISVATSAGHASADVWASASEGSDIDVEPGLASATGDALAPSQSVATGAGHASATGSATDQAVLTGSSPAAGHASATADAPAQSVAISAPTGHAAATGAAADATGSIAVNSPLASAQATALASDHTVTVVSGSFPTAEAAAATGAAYQPSISVASSAEHAAASVSALTVAIAIVANPGLASALAAAYPGAVAAAVAAGMVTLTADAHGGGTSVAVPAPHVPLVAEAYQPVRDGVANAGHAAALLEALQASASIRAGAGFITVSGAAYDLTILGPAWIASQIITRTIGARSRASSGTATSAS